MSALSITTPFSNSATSQSGWFGSLPLLPAETRISYETFGFSSIIYSNFLVQLVRALLNSSGAIMTHGGTTLQPFAISSLAQANVIIIKTEKPGRSVVTGCHRRPAQRWQVDFIQ